MVAQHNYIDAGLRLVSESPIEKKIRSFLSLEQGWHFSEGEAPTPERVENAILMMHDSIGWDFDIDAFPGIAGQILLAFYYKETYLEFVFENDDKITFLHEEKNEEVEFKQNLSQLDALQKINAIGESIWSSSGLSIQLIGTTGLEDFNQSHSMSQAVTPGSLSSTVIVLPEPIPVYVNTFVSITAMSLHLPQSF